MALLSTDQTQPGGQPLNPGTPPAPPAYGAAPTNFDYSRISALAPQSGATAQQTFDNINANYWAQDRPDVLNAAQAWLKAGGQAPSSQPAPPTTPTGPDYTSPTGQVSAVQSWLNAGPNEAWKSQADYFTQRVNETGGFTPENVAYWQNMIQQGMTPDQAAGASGATGSVTASTGPTGMNDPNSTALFNTLMGIANESQVVDPNDPIIKAQTNAVSAQQQQGARNAQSQLAAGSAGTYDPIGAQTRSLQETATNNTSAFQANVMANELAARRTQIQNALSGAAGLLTAEQQMSLQEELTKLQQAQQLLEFQQGQTQQESQFARNLEQGAYEFDTTANNGQQNTLSS